jgi:hypothetical protein
MQKVLPYISWSTFLKALDVLAPHFAGKIEIPSFAGFSASSASQTMQAFRFFRLITADSMAAPDLSLLIEHHETRPAIIGKLLRQCYVPLFAPNTKTVSRSALEALVEQTGLSAATRRKAVTFFLNAADFAGIAVVSGRPESPAGKASPPDAAPAVPPANKRSLAIELRTGGTIEMIADFDPLSLDKEDREFVFDLIDRLKGYPARKKREEHLEQSAEDEREVPF